MTRIAIVDPQPAVRAGLAMLLRTEPGLIPVGSATGVEDGFQLVERLRPGVVLLELHLLDGDGLAVKMNTDGDVDFLAEPPLEIKNGPEELLKIGKVKLTAKVAAKFCRRALW